MSDRKLHYGVRLTAEQLKYLRTVGKPSEWIRQAVDEKRRRETKNHRLRWIEAGHESSTEKTEFESTNAKLKEKIGKTFCHNISRGSVKFIYVVTYLSK